LRKNPRWEKKRIQCPESMRPAYLMVEWRMEKDGKDVISTVSCDNPNLHDLGGGDCTWSCWEKLARKV
jgi:hypothetical protein